MDVAAMQWWEREKLLTKKDREAFYRAKDLDWTDIDEDDAETDAGRYELHYLKMQKYRREEIETGMN